ncbi:4'-phosphopantetheinyl transferase family protein [Psychromicrobium lacuslunae]|uniref:4'-phosphopantetheinyl transferase family protein n=1 Tax=Psychromicrobium lacuslunae TaxID=1618207 RepID=UPI000697709E|nr:4'-phosphopantetheinyl transferase superfamily protein [Psychromicrobium lacuslunae]
MLVIDGVSILAVDTDAESDAEIAEPQAEWLSSAERARADQFATKQLRHRFIARRAALRRFVGAQLGIEPRELEPNYRCPDHGQGPEVDHGQPGFTLAGQPIHLALSSSSRENWVLLALSRRIVKLGVDLERIAAVSFEGFDASVLNAQERGALAALPSSEQDAFRARCWARKEALVKAWGTGLRQRPADLDSDSNGLLDIDAEQLSLPTGFAVALAVLP